MPKDSGDVVIKRRRRKPTIWTREKISKLIELYRESDCLWNHYSGTYRSKECRAKAIEHICESLGITKIDYGKKVHNLRNQFNSELKKLERRLEESGSASPTVEKTCRWEHFNTLMFLRSVIEPRPGYQQTSPSQSKVEYFSLRMFQLTNFEIFLENDHQARLQHTCKERRACPNVNRPLRINSFRKCQRNYTTRIFTLYLFEASIGQ